MTHAAIGKLLRVNVIFRDQFPAQCHLICGLPFQIENLVTGTNVFLGRAVALQAPFHIERVRFPRERHLVQLPVAGNTTDAVIYVDAVIKEDKIRRAIDTVPFQPRVICQAVSHRGKHGRVFPNL